jgi:hypothetical protein
MKQIINWLRCHLAGHLWTRWCCKDSWRTPSNEWQRTCLRCNKHETGEW